MMLPQRPPGPTFPLREACAARESLPNGLEPSLHRSQDSFSRTAGIPQSSSGFSLLVIRVAKDRASAPVRASYCCWSRNTGPKMSGRGQLASEGAALSLPDEATVAGGRVDGDAGAQPHNVPMIAAIASPFQVHR